jgi:hypothetical protein
VLAGGLGLGLGQELLVEAEGGGGIPRSVRPKKECNGGSPDGGVRAAGALLARAGRMV